MVSRVSYVGSVSGLIQGWVVVTVIGVGSIWRSYERRLRADVDWPEEWFGNGTESVGKLPPVVFAGSARNCR